MKTVFPTVLAAALVAAPISSVAAPAPKSESPNVLPVNCVRTSDSAYKIRFTVLTTKAVRPDEITVRISERNGASASQPAARLFSSRPIYYQPSLHCMEQVGGTIHLGRLGRRGAVVRFVIETDLSSLYFPNPGIGVTKGGGPHAGPISPGDWPANWPSPVLQMQPRPKVLTVRFPHQRSAPSDRQIYSYRVWLKNRWAIGMKPGIINH